ncbi:suppressor of fused domain protein [Actinomadura macrotermitis]|uniref:Suppressor of fused-like domain-containing protein n=1 Tax=Actinomadura macrotermitis TaxID=2585200 RepID=A0A7K0BX62_9ACTN|nr:suppressor of fused domain protein [Actinomadura macrotermitis]MQY05767.1 hypothetical protein [Actinomadura macrotermitis]
MSAEAHRILHSHLAAQFEGHEIACVSGVAGPIEQRIPGFRVFRIGPGPRFQGWTYVTSGCWQVTAAEQDGHGLEFVLMADRDDWQHLESVTMNAYYHAGPPRQRLDHGHVVPIGRPWFDDSACDRYLVSLPYPLGPDFESCSWSNGHIRILWLLPITLAERDLWREQGLEALESRFDEVGIDFANPDRPSVA